MNQRPKTSGRPPTGLNTRPITSVGRVFTDGRTTATARIGSAVGTARPGTRSSLTTAQGRGIATPITVIDRPMTQQGLGGLKTAVQRNQRVVQDKTYFLGLLRSKMNELNSEISKLMKEIDQLTNEQSTYLTYDKRAKALAQEIKDLQGELGDYNMLVDKLNTDTEIDEVNQECLVLKAQNEQEAKTVDFIFAERREKELQIKQLEEKIEEEKKMAEKLVSTMKPELKEKYLGLKQNNLQLLEQMEKLQQELDSVNSRKTALEDEISISPIKQEAVVLYEKIRELEEKKESLIEEERMRGTPAQEQEKLLKQVKEDNQEIATMERKTNEILEQIMRAREELQQIEQDLDENQNERSQKYRELKKRDESMTQFLDSFDSMKTAEVERKTQLEQSIVELLEKTSRYLSHFHHLPNPQELGSLRDDLHFKEGEMEKSKSTASSLAYEQNRISLDLQKIEQLEEKIKNEIVALQKKMAMMEEEMAVFSNIESLKIAAEEHTRQLTEKSRQLSKQRDYIAHALKEVQTQYDSTRNQLNENETHLQLTNLERKWQHVEQTNFAIKEFIASKLAETDYQPITRNVFYEATEYNKLLQSVTDKMLKR